MTRSFEGMDKLGKELLDTGVDSLAAVSNDAQAIAASASDYATRAVESGGEAISKVMSAKSIENVIEIQTAYLKQAYEGFVAEATKLGELYADLTKDAYRPFEAIVVRATT